MAARAESSDFILFFYRRVGEAVGNLLDGWGFPELAGNYTLEPASRRGHGDMATSMAMVAASRTGGNPRALAGKLVEAMQADDGLEKLTRFEVAGPGFINFHLREAALVSAALDALALGDRFGSRAQENPEKILLEFVSANPTGQLHAGHARYAAYGDSLKRILAFLGNHVTSEFYINDFGSQMESFGATLAARYAQDLGLEAEIPADGYRGEYPRHVAGRIRDEIGDRLRDRLKPAPTAEAVDFFKRRGCEIVLAEMEAELGRFRVDFDSWFSEAGLYASGAAARVIENLKKDGHAVSREGALWFKTARFGDDKDRVLIRKNGEPTYFASDIAYHAGKLERHERFSHLINVWGADHHGYVARIKAAMKALFPGRDEPEVIIGQLVSVIEKGERKQMSKRKGTMVTLSELLDGIGVDAARFFLVDRSHDSAIDLDMEKARLKSEENPVYYVQYAHARISSIIKKAEAGGFKPVDHAGYDTLSKQERQLILSILFFPRVVQGAGDMREPHRLTVYSRELAASFHTFYHDCPVLKAEPEAASFRLDLCRLVRNTIATSLRLVGVSAPEAM